MGPKKKKKNQSADRVDRINSGTSGAMLPENMIALQMAANQGTLDSPPDPYKAFARFPGKKTLLAPMSPKPKPKAPKSQPKVTSLPSPPPSSYQSISPIPNRPWNPKVYAVESVKFEPRCEPTKTIDVTPEASGNRALPAFHGLKSLLLDCEKNSNRKGSDDEYRDGNNPKKSK